MFVLINPLAINKLKELAESVPAYEVNANFTLAQIERLSETAMTPTDWMFVTKACLTSMGQYIEWKALWHDYSQAQAHANATAGQPAWSFEMLTGQGQWTANQTAYPLEVYVQINTCAIKAWKALTNKGEVSGNLTKVIQGPNEPFSDFVARMVEAAGRIFGDQEQAMPLIEQLIFEQCTKECRNAIIPWKAKGLQAWLKACREIGGPLTNAGLAAEFLSSAHNSSSYSSIVSPSTIHCLAVGVCMCLSLLLGGASQRSAILGFCPQVEQSFINSVGEWCLHMGCVPSWVCYWLTIPSVSPPSLLLHFL